MIKYILLMLVFSTIVGCARAPKRDLASNCQLETTNYYDVYQQYERCRQF